MSEADSPNQEVEGAEEVEQYEEPERSVDSEPEVEYSPEQLWAEQRSAELAEEFTDEGQVEAEEESAEGEEQQAEEVAAKEPAAEAEPEPKKEGLSAPARRQLAKEKKLRSEREAFQKERDGWLSEREETLTKIKAFEESRETAYLDPIAHLEEIGFDKEDIFNVAREIYYREMPEHASPSTRAEMANIEHNRKQRKLERGQEKLEEKISQAELKSRQEAYEANYRSNLTRSVATIDAEKHPFTAKYAKNDFNEVVEGMFAVAVQHAQENGGERDLTPEECLEAVEGYLSTLEPQGQPAPQETQTEEEAPEPARKKRVIKNKTSASRPNDKHDDGLSYDELAERSRERFYSKLREKDMVK